MKRSSSLPQERVHPGRKAHHPNTRPTFCYYEREWRSYPQQRLPRAALTVPAWARWGRNDGTFLASSATRGPHPEYMIRRRQEGGETRPPLGSPGIYSRNAVALVFARDWGCCLSTTGDTMKYWISSAGCDRRCASKACRCQIGVASGLMRAKCTRKLDVVTGVHSRLTQLPKQCEQCVKLYCMKLCGNIHWIW